MTYSRLKGRKEMFSLINATGDAHSVGSMSVVCRAENEGSAGGRQGFCPGFQWVGGGLSDSFWCLKSNIDGYILKFYFLTWVSHTARGQKVRPRLKLTKRILLSTILQGDITTGNHSRTWGRNT